MSERKPPAKVGGAGRPAPDPAQAPGYWLVKSEPFQYSWQQLEADGRTGWDGVRNAEARNHLAAMAAGDLAFFYHSNEGKEVVGIARVVRTAYPDPTTDDPRWLAVEFAPVKPLKEPVTLATMKTDPKLRDLQLIRRSRLSVVPVSAAHFAHILSLAKTRL